MRFTVVICTCNRATDLEDTLTHLAGVTTTKPWEVVVVDNNSSDETPRMLPRLARNYPVPLRVFQQPTPGKYGALNLGIHNARGAVIAATDDDAHVSPDWLDRADEGLARYDCDFVGGPVRPLWGGPIPPWLNESSAVLQKVIAICDYGPSPRPFGDRIAWPLGVNVAYRRDAFERAGFFDPSLGRKAGTLRSQSQREWHIRARGAGIKGFYLPDMIVEHRVPVERLTRQYFRRWHYWNGISRARMYWKAGLDPEEPEAMRHTNPLPSCGGVPVRLLAKGVRSLRSWAWRSLRGDRACAFEYELWLCFLAGFAQESRRQAKAPFAGAPASTLAP
jgi:glycosyltransferase involved in cell wall biosynthesis